MLAVMSTNAHVHMHAADPPLHRMLGWYQWDVLIGLIEQILQQQKSTHSSVIGGVLFCCFIKKYSEYQMYEKNRWENID